MAKRTWSEDDLINAVASSISMRGVLSKLELHHTGGNLVNIKKNILKRNLDTSHFLGQAARRGTSYTTGRALPLNEVLIQNSSYSRYSLKKRLIKEGLLDNSKCNNPNCPMSSLEWAGKPLVLEMDHINGIYNDNRLENLWLICPNCHSQLPTTHGKNIKRKQKYCKCGNPIHHQSQRCQPCSINYRIKKSYTPKIHKSRPTKIQWPSNEELEKMVWEKPRSVLAKELGVSDKAIAKRCNKLGISQPPRGYWMKQHTGKH